MTGLTAAPTWRGPSRDPNDVQFGDLVHSRGDDLFEVLETYEVVLVGEPFDQAVIGRKGARYAPAALRRALASLKTNYYGADRPADAGDGDAGWTIIDRPPGGGLSRLVADLGDIAVGFDDSESVPKSALGIQEQVRMLTKHLYDGAALPVFLGGDNSLTYPNVAPLLDRGSVGVVNFDAHLDVRTVREDATSGTPYRQLFEEGLDAYACVGARHFETAGVYANYVYNRGGTIVTAEEVGDDPHGAVERAVDALGDVDFVYVSVDLDVLDAAAAPGVSAPTPGGVTTRELFRMVRDVAGVDRLTGFEVVECSPPVDEQKLTVNAGARVIAHFLSGYPTATRADD
ncbi:MAG: formimidoylglutamase [Halobacteriota archaeon]